MKNNNVYSRWNHKIFNILMVATLIAALCVSTPAFAAAAAADEAVEGTADEAAAAPVDETAAVASTASETESEATATVPARRARRVSVSLEDAAGTAEKMYYCGELYLFADSMIKLNYEMASIAIDMKDALQSGALTKTRAKLNTMIRKYNALSETYNSWVDVKADLEFFIDTIGARTVITKSQLQTAFKRTLTVINNAEDMLEAAQAYYKTQATDERRALNGAADALGASAAEAVNIITPYAQAAIAAYRSLFDLFAQQAGLEIEYKTWQNPETT